MLITAVRAIYGISHNKPRKVNIKGILHCNGSFVKDRKDEKDKKDWGHGSVWAVSGWLALHFVRCTGWGLCQGHKGRKRRKRQGSMAEWGLWPVIFQQHRAPGGAMWRWAAWLSAPPAGPWAVGGMALCPPRRGYGPLHFPAAWYTHILCHVLCVLYVLFMAHSMGCALCAQPQASVVKSISYGILYKIYIQKRRKRRYETGFIHSGYFMCR